MRATLLSCVVLALTTTTAAAQNANQFEHRRPTIGIGLGGFAAIPPNGDVNAILSGTVEVPFANRGRIRIEAARTALPIVPDGAWDWANPTDIAHIRRISVSAVVMGDPAIVSGIPVGVYIGAGIGFHRDTFDRAARSRVSADLYVHGGAELRLSDRLALDGELGLHGFRDDPWYQRKLITGETMIRLKVGL